MRKSLLLPLALMLGFGTAWGKAPETLAGRWVSEPATAVEDNATVETVYDLDFANDGRTVNFKAHSKVKDMQMGSREMKVSGDIDISGKADWKIEGDTLKITFSIKPSVKADPASIDLNIPAPMKVAMADRLNEFMTAFTGGLEEGFLQGLMQEGVRFDLIDVDPERPTVLTAQEEGVPVTFLLK